MRTMKITHRLAALATVGAMTGLSGTAMATPSNENFAKMSENILTASNQFTTLINLVAYIAGTGLGVTGVMKLKAHVDNPGNAPMKDGLIRLGAGGALLALPWLTNTMIGTVADGSGTEGNVFGKITTFQ